MTLLEFNSETLVLLLGGGVIGTIFTAVITWLRFSKKDRADTVKIDAEAAKTLAEANEIKAKAEVTVADAALNLAKRLGEECDMTKTQLEKTQKELDDAHQQLNKLTIQLHFVQEQLEAERRKNNDIIIELTALRAEITQMKNKK